LSRVSGIGNFAIHKNFSIFGKMRSAIMRSVKSCNVIMHNVRMRNVIMRKMRNVITRKMRNIYA
jgi:hypothetical protein